MTSPTVSPRTVKLPPMQRHSSVGSESERTPIASGPSELLNRTSRSSRRSASIAGGSHAASRQKRLIREGVQERSSSLGSEDDARVRTGVQSLPGSGTRTPDAHGLNKRGPLDDPSRASERDEYVIPASSPRSRPPPPSSRAPPSTPVMPSTPPPSSPPARVSSRGRFPTEPSSNSSTGRGRAQAVEDALPRTSAGSSRAGRGARFTSPALEDF